jgi:8-oxo-dGTP pyrophosphatase MutT (NUDIX family)
LQEGWTPDVMATLLRAVYLAYRGFLFFIRPVTLGVRVVMIRDGEVLLVRHTYIAGWYFPGGAVDRGETLDAAARREAREETGAELRDVRLVGAYTSFREWKSDHNIVFLCSDFTLGGKPDHEIAEMRFFPLRSLPADMFPGHRRRLDEYVAGTASPQFGEW